MIRTVGGYSIFVFAILLLAFGVSYRFRQPPAEDDLTDVIGSASDVSQSLIVRRGREYIEFTVDGKRFSCGSDKSNFPRLVDAVRTGQPLSIGIDPNDSRALVGGMTRFYRIRQGDEVLASYDRMREQFYKGRVAVLVVTAGISMCLCVPAYQLTFGRLSARQSKSGAR